MEGDDLVIVRLGVEFHYPALVKVVCELTDMLRYRISRIKEIKRPDECIPETVGHTPRVTTLSHDNPLDAKIESRLADTLRDLLHIFVIADKDPEVGRLGGIRTQCPTDARLMEYLGITDQAVNVRLSKKISRGCDQQDVGTLLVQREFHRNVDVLFNLFLEAL